MSLKKNNPNIKIKLLLGYSLTIIVLAVAGTITYFSFTQLFSSVETLARPDTKLITINHLLADISEAEASLRSYILTNNKGHLDQYEVSLESITEKIASLKEGSLEDTMQLNKLDSISILLNAKYDAIDDLASLMHQSRSSSFSSTALERINESRYDSAKVDTTLMTYTETTTHIKPRGLVSEGIKEPEPRGLFQAIKNLFSGKTSEENTPVEESDAEEEDFYTETRVTIDTSVVSVYRTDTVLSNLKEIFSDMQRKESALNRLLNAKQLEVLQQDRLIMDKIRMIVTSLERREILKAEEQTKEAKMLADQFAFTILGIGVVGLLAGTVLVLLILHDINKSNYYKERLEEAKNKAEHLAKAKEEFLANMSHEIRTPLNAIQGFTEQLLLTPLASDQHEYLKAVHQSSEHLLSTVNDILDYSKIGVGKLAIERIPFQPRTVVHEVYTLLQLKAKEKGLNYQYFIDEDCPETLLGDPFRLKQILFNLVGNALKFTDKGSVFIVCKSRKAFSSPKKVVLSIEVRDTGVGINKENISKIFEGFQQADSSTTRRFGGTGLGLTICKQLVELQQGALLVDSEEGKGSVFTVNIPYQISPASETGTETLPQIDSVKKGLSGLNILLVDDDNLNIMLLKTIMSKYGGVTTDAANGLDGLEQSQKKQFDLIITDIQMPQMSGFEFAEAVRNNKGSNADTPIIGLTAHVTQKEKYKAKSVGITALIGKPFKEKMLMATLYEHLEIQGVEDDHDDVPTLVEEGINGVNSACPAYSLAGFESFVRGDSKALANLLNTMIVDQKRNIALIQQYAEEGNIKEVSSLAHKMCASFGYLKADAIVEKLQKLETLARDQQPADNLEEVTNILVKEATVLIDEVEKQVAEM